MSVHLPYFLIFLTRRQRHIQRYIVFRSALVRLFFFEFGHFDREISSLAYKFFIVIPSGQLMKPANPKAKYSQLKSLTETLEQKKCCNGSTTARSKYRSQTYHPYKN